MRIIWSAPALNELVNIKQFIALNNPKTAEEYTIKLYDKVSNLLQNFPQYGRKIPEIDNDSFREIIYGNYRVMYKIKAGVVSILAVRNSRQLFIDTFE